MVVGVAYLDEVDAAYAPLGKKYKADEAADQAQREGLYVCTGGVISASATQGKLDKALGTDFVGTTEKTYIAQTAQPCCLTATSTTVAAGSNGQTITGLTSGQLIVGATGAFAAAGLLAVVRAGAVISCIQYASLVDGTHFGGVTLVSGWTNITFSNTTDTVVQINNDLTAFKWLNCEVDSSGNYQAVAGSAGSSTTATKPSLTASRQLHGSVLLQPVSGNTNALSIDELTTAANGKSKLMQARRLNTLRAQRILYADPGKGSGTAMTTSALVSLVNATGSIPADSLSVGDVIQWTVGVLFSQSSASAGTYRTQLLIGGSAIFDYTSASYSATALFRWQRIQLTGIVTAVGASGNINWEVFGSLTSPAVHTPNENNVDGSTFAIDTTVANTLDIKSAMTAPNAANTGLVRTCILLKTPVA